MKLKIGIIGTNFISSDFCEAAALIPEAELYAVCSRKQETGDSFTKKGEDFWDNYTVNRL